MTYVFMRDYSNDTLTIKAGDTITVYSMEEDYSLGKITKFEDDASFRGSLPTEIITNYCQYLLPTGIK